MSNFAPNAAQQQIRDIKHKMRPKLLNRRAEIPKDKQEKDSARVCALLWEVDEVQKADLLLGYSSLIEEVNINAFLDRLLTRNVNVWLPRLKEVGHMEAAPVTSLSDTRVGPMGLNEPTASLSSWQRVPDVVVVPGVGFDPDGNRLGFGLGYYDNFLASLDHRPFLIGVAFDEQMVKKIPTEPHDIPMDLVVTPAGIYR